MVWGFNNNARHTTANVEGIRAQVVQTLHGSFHRLEAKGISREFAAASKQGDPLGDMGILGSLLAHIVMWGAILHGMESFVESRVGPVALFDAFNHSILAPAFEAASMLTDDKAHVNRRRVLNDYPEGRRQPTLFDPALNKKFNLVAANDEWRFNFDTQAEMACMFEMLDMLGDIERQGIYTLEMNTDRSVYDTLREMQEQVRPASGIRVFQTPVRRVVS